jgi:hypothetical protein
VYDFYYFAIMVGLLSYITIAKWEHCTNSDPSCLSILHGRGNGRNPTGEDVYHSLMPAEWACMSMVVLYAADEARHMQDEGFDEWKKSQWNRIDAVMVSFFTLAYLARFANEPIWARIVLSLTSWICWFRMLNITGSVCFRCCSAAQLLAKTAD